MILVSRMEWEANQTMFLKCEPNLFDYFLQLWVLIFEELKVLDLE